MTRKKKTQAPIAWPNNLAMLSEEHGWTQADLARESGFTPQEITRWWNGTRELKQSHIVKFSSVFQCPPGDILNFLPAARGEREIIEKYRRFNEHTKARFLGMADALEMQNDKKTEITKPDLSIKRPSE